MKLFRVTFQAIIVLFLLIYSIVYALAGEPAGAENPAVIIELAGNLTDTDGEPIRDGIVTITYDGMIRKAVSNKDGQFRFQNLNTSLADITFEANGYETMEEQGIYLAEHTDLSRVLRKMRIRIILLLPLLIPGVLGLGLSTWKEYRASERFHRRPDPLEATEGKEEEYEGPDWSFGLRFIMSFWAGLIWGGTLVLLACLGHPGPQGITRLHLFHPDLGVDFYIPILGFLGALLYVLYPGPERFTTRFWLHVPRGWDFGMRLIMAPYVAIVAVVLFGKDLGVADLQSEVAKGALAFLSGLLVVPFLQRLILKGEEAFGRWKAEIHYFESEIYERFGITEGDDRKLISGGLRYVKQLQESDEEDLRRLARKVGFDENMLLSFRRQLKKEELNRDIGGLVWERLREINVHTIEEFARLLDPVLKEISEIDPKLDVKHLIALRDWAKKLVKT